jgi:acyl-CoA thioesterase-1
MAFGDSLTAGYGADPGQSYPDYLQRELDKLGYAYHVVNLGVSGETTSDALARVDVVIAQRPRIVILEFGGNDGLRGLPITAARANLDRVMARLQAAHIRILLAGITLPPNYGQDYIRPFQTMYHDLAVRYHAPLIPFLLEGVFEHGLFQQDGIHPNAQGYAMVAQTVLRYLRPLLGPMAKGGRSATPRNPTGCRGIARPRTGLQGLLPWLPGSVPYSRARAITQGGGKHPGCPRAPLCKMC